MSMLPKRSLAKHRLLWVNTALVMGCSLVSGSLSAGDDLSTDRVPNVLLIVSDDQGIGDASCYASTDLQTPVMDQVAARGVRFERFRVNPLCAPTRASMMTGVYSLECGMWRGPGAISKQPRPAGGWPADVRRIRDEFRLLPQLLSDAGYATGIFGKWHLGYDPVNVPNARGFEEFLGFLAGSHPYNLSRRSKILRNDQPADVAGHTTDLFADAAIEFIKRHRDRPFFCYLPFNAVHGPLRNAERDADSALPKWLDTYADRGVPQPRRDYCGVMAHADARAGDVLHLLDELNLTEQTLVIYLSDNGAQIDKYPGNNGPLRDGKGSAYEGGIRVPAVMQWPGVIPGGIVSQADAVHFDLFTTILAAAGVEVPQHNGRLPVRGVNLLTHLKSGGTQPLPDRYLFWDLYGKQAALHGDWKLVGNLPNHHGNFTRAVADARQANYELYHLAEDPSETTDVAAQHPEIYDDLKRRHIEWLRTSTQHD